MDFRQLFAAPLFADEEKTRRARVSHVILWSILLVVNVLIVALVLAQPEHRVRWTASLLAIDFTFPILILLNRGGYPRLTGGLVVGITWFLVTGMALTAGGIHAPVSMAYIVIVLIVGLLFGERAGVMAAVLFSLTGLVFVILEKTGHLPVSHVNVSAPAHWITQTLFVALAASLQYLANRSLKSALAQAQKELGERQRAELELREKEERFREVYESTSEHIFLLDVTPEGRFYYHGWNPANARAAGITSEELAGMTPEQLFPPDQAQRVRANYQRCIDQDRSIQYEHALTFGGKLLDFNVTLFPVRNEVGKIHRIVGVARNVTEQKQAENELRESEERFREVFEASSDYIFLLDVTQEGKFYYHSWNPSCERAGGFSSAQLAGKIPEDLFPPDQARSVAAAYQRCIDQNASIGYAETLKLGGKWYQFHTTLFPVRNAAGRVHRIVGVAHDVTEARRAEAELRESEDRYRIVVEQTGQMVYEYDAATGRLSWRGAIEKLTGFTVEEFQQVNIHKWEEMIHPEDRAAAMDAFHKAMEVVGEYHVEYRFQCKRSGYIHIEDHGLFLPGPDGKSERMLGVMADITNFKEAERELRQSRDELEERVRKRTRELQTVNKELEAFTYSVSHDLRSPARVVESFADLLIEDYAKDMPEEAQQFLGEIKTGAQRMSALIQGLLRLSHVDREPLVPRCVKLGVLVREIIEELKREQKGREMEIRLGELPDSMGDPALLRQVFVNLLNNSIKFTGGRAKALIEVGCKIEGERPVCFVRDNGVGFDIQKADKLFGLFQRLHSPDEFTGTGVGLSIVQRIIHRHGGRIWAESEMDKGTTFYFTLPECELAS
jgi:PAS domain S-box-containing protein